jgi:spoIIIJ-associated protein
MTDSRPTLEIIAPTIDEAIEEGLAQLGLAREDVEINVLDKGSTGLFGLRSRQVRIQIIVVSDSQENHNLMPESTRNADTPDNANALVMNHEQIIETARSTVSDLLEKMNVESTLDVYIGDTYGSDNRTPVNIDISGDDLSILIGHRGETLNALQYIARLILGKELEHAVPLNIDVDGYRKRREVQIRQLARRMADQVNETQRSLSLEPMPANERRLAHLELQDDQTIYTESTGSGRYRKVVIYPQ